MDIFNKTKYTRKSTRQNKKDVQLGCYNTRTETRKQLTALFTPQTANTQGDQRSPPGDGLLEKRNSRNCCHQKHLIICQRLLLVCGPANVGTSKCHSYREPVTQCHNNVVLLIICFYYFVFLSRQKYTCISITVQELSHQGFQ